MFLYLLSGRVQLMTPDILPSLTSLPFLIYFLEAFLLRYVPIEMS